MNIDKHKPCEYCGASLPYGGDLRTRRIRSRHFAHCEVRLAQKHAAMITQQKKSVSLETVYETIVEWDEGGGKRSRRELANRIVALYADTL